ncbi:MAG: TetR/AcrR family transcriptional regulator, partial [Pseudomonadota bacterium]|nr:TetR/AcrR family transcriptional regulator [Pseudomonadota bacterium]
PTLPPRDRLQKLVKATLDAYEGADDMHKVQLNAGEALDEDQLAQVTTMNRQIVKRIADVIAEIHPELAAPSGSLLMPVTMSLFGMMNWAYLWFREDGPMTREDYARMATTLILDGVKGVA